jgi:hypothetical protein
MNMQKMPITLSLTIALLATYASNSAFAGSATVKSAEGELSTFEYNETMLRVSIPQGDGYLVVRDNSIYSVMQADGRTLVIDASSAMKGMGSAIAQATPSDFNAEVVSLEKTGRSETIAGIKGDVYDLRFVDEDGKEQNEELVLSDDSRALDFRDALFLMMGAAVQALDIDETTDGAKVMRNQLEALDAGILRYGGDLTLTRIDGDSVDPERFTLPAEPMDMSNLGALFGAMAAEAPADPDSENGEDETENTGLFKGMMGALGSKVNRQADRLGGSAENEVDRETDEKVDNAVGKAFGKLFGR